VVIGTDYVGLISGACLADFGNRATCVDIDKKKIEGLRTGEIPIFEPGLFDVMARNVAAERISFTNDASQAIQGAEVIFIITMGVGTSPSGDGSVDLRCVEEIARAIGRVFNSYLEVVDKSTVPLAPTGSSRNGLPKSWMPARPNMNSRSWLIWNS